MEIEYLTTLGAMGTAVATIALVLILWKAVKQMEHTVSLSKIQTSLRFRPWVGPSTGIKFLDDSTDAGSQFEIVIKNYGEIPAESVNVFFMLDTKLIERNKLDLSKADVFNLGPVLPNMEKRYWFFVDNDLMEKAKNGEEKIFTLLYFQYKISAGTSYYGMISEYQSKDNKFIHKDMWVDSADKTKSN